MEKEKLLKHLSYILRDTGCYDVDKSVDKLLKINTISEFHNRIRNVEVNFNSICNFEQLDSMWLDEFAELNMKNMNFQNIIII